MPPFFQIIPLTHSISPLPQASLVKARTWIAELQRQADPSIIVCLAGNKLDLAETQRQVPTAEAQKFADEEGLLFFEVSAKTADGVEAMFQAVGESSFHRRSKTREETRTRADVASWYPQRTNCHWISRLRRVERALRSPADEAAWI
jgi:GTPase SAR1 family protein